MRTAQLDLKITAAAAARIAASRASDESTPALLLAQTSDGDNFWTTGWYDSEQLRSLEPMRAAANLPLLFDCGGLVLCIPQIQVLELLKGRILDVTDSGYTVL